MRRGHHDQCTGGTTIDAQGAQGVPQAARRGVLPLRGRAEEAPGAELRHGQGTTLTVLMCLGLLVLFLEWSDELIEVVAPRLLHLDDFAEVLLPVVHQVHLEQRRVRRVSEARERSA